MGTNYYIVKKEKRCPHCKQELDVEIEQRVHIGKSSFGWPFVVAHDNFKSLSDLLTAIADYQIVDEYGGLVDLSALLQIMWARENDYMQRNLTEMARESAFIRQYDGKVAFISGEFS